MPPTDTNIYPGQHNNTRTKTLVQATRNTVIPNDGSVVKIAPWSFIIEAIAKPRNGEVLQ